MCDRLLESAEPVLNLLDAVTQWTKTALVHNATVQHDVEPLVDHTLMAVRVVRHVVHHNGTRRLGVGQNFRRCQSLLQAAMEPGQEIKNGVKNTGEDVTSGTEQSRTLQYQC